MKLILILLLLSATAQGQNITVGGSSRLGLSDSLPKNAHWDMPKDSIPKPGKGLTSANDIGIGYFDSTGTEVTVWKSGRLEIKGDTVAAIKMLHKRLQEGFKREMELEQQLGKAINGWEKLIKDMQGQLRKKN